MKKRGKRKKGGIIEDDKEREANENDVELDQGRKREREKKQQRKLGRQGLSTASFGTDQNRSEKERRAKKAWKGFPARGD